MECRFCNILQKQYNYEEIDYQVQVRVIRVVIQKK